MSENYKLLSIVIPVYNAEKFIADCLDSLLNQDIGEGEYEIICINDGSTDGSLTVLEQYAKKYSNMLVFDKPNSGVSSTRNMGFAHSRGQYVWFIDADDWIARNSLGLIRKQIEQYHPGVIQVHYDWIKAEWRVNQCKTVALDISKVICSAPGHEALQYDGAWSCVINRDLLTKYHLKFNETLHYGEDILFIRDLFDFIRIEPDCNADIYKIIHLQNEIFYYYRVHDESAFQSSWTTNRKKYTEALLQLARINKERMLDTSKPQWYTEKYSNLYYQRMYNCMMHWLPGISVNLKEQLSQLKEEGLYPAPAPKSIAMYKEFTKANGAAEKVKRIYKYFAFRFSWLYPLYYSQMKKKYNSVNK